MIAWLFGKTEYCLAVGTLTVDVCLAVTEFVAVEFKPALYRIPYLQEFLIFRASAVNITGHHAHYDGYDQCDHKNRQRKASDEGVDDRYDQVKHDKRVVELIVTVSAVHESYQFFSE